MTLNLFNTPSRKIEPFTPVSPPKVNMYCCGLTVYYYTHIGNLRTYVNSDILRRTLEFSGYEVQQVMNITDVGHMTSDEDEGDDKLEVSARKEGKDPWKIARFYEDYFLSSLEKMNIRTPHILCRATEHINDMINLIKILEEKGFTYRTGIGVIFDTSRFPDYGKFAHLDLKGQQAGFRVETDPERKQPWDFALWITNQPNHIMQWDSPWGRGFPGWHIECSAMSMKYLGQTLDIHTGGIDHINIHHTNEIAQSEAATGKPFTKTWFHSNFLNIEGCKMSKSLGNLFTLEDLKSRGFSPLSLRYLFLGSSYRKVMNFTWESLNSAQTSLVRLWKRFAELPETSSNVVEEAMRAFQNALSEDLNTTKALSVVWNLMDSGHPPEAVAATLLKMDEILGLDLSNASKRLAALRAKPGENEEKAHILAAKRELLRKQKKYAEADEIRQQIVDLGFQVEDTVDGYRVVPCEHSL